MYVCDTPATTVALAGLMTMLPSGLGWNSYAPRSSNARGPLPVFAVAGIVDALVVLDVGRAAGPPAPEFAESIAGEPASQMEVAAGRRSCHRGSAWSPCVSCPVADRNAASEL